MTPQERADRERTDAVAAAYDAVIHRARVATEVNLPTWDALTVEEQRALVPAMVPWVSAIVTTARGFYFAREQGTR